MASNPKRKRRGKTRRAPKKRRAPAKRRSARRRRKVSASSRKRTGLRVNARRARRRRNPKTVRTDVRTVKVMRSNARRARRRRAPVKRKLRRNPSRRYTVAFAPAALRTFASHLSKTARRAARTALRRHPTGGVYVALPTWHGSAAEAKRLASRAWLLLVYSAGRRRVSLASSAPPRVVAVP